MKNSTSRFIRSGYPYAREVEVEVEVEEVEAVDCRLSERVCCVVVVVCPVVVGEVEDMLGLG